jgi:hypothetical protein
MSLLRHRTLRTVGLSNRFSACGHNLTNLSLASIQHLRQLDTRLPHLPVSGFDPIKTFAGYPFPGLFTRFGSEKHGYGGANRNPGCYVFTCFFHLSPSSNARFRRHLCSLTSN